MSQRPVPSGTLMPYRLQGATLSRRTPRVPEARRQPRYRVVCLAAWIALFARAAGAAGQNRKPFWGALCCGGFPETAGCAGGSGRGNEAAIKRSNGAHGTTILIRQVNYLNNMVEQDHRGVKRGTRPLLGYTSFEAAPDTLVGIALMDMSKKRPRVVEA